MILAESYLRIAPSLPASERRALGSQLFPIGETAAKEFLRSYAAERFVEIVLEDGSTKLWIRLRASAIGLVALVGGYGTIRAGLDYVRHDGRAAATWISRQVAPQLPTVPNLQRNRAPGAVRLRRLFELVESGDLTAEEASRRAEAILHEYGETPDTVNSVMRVMQEEFTAIKPTNVKSPKAPRTPPPLDRARPIRGKRLSVFRDPRTGRLIFSES
jgi:hypothetical protein